MAQVTVPLPVGFNTPDDFPKARERLVNCFNVGGNRIVSRPGIESYAEGVGVCRGAEYYRGRLFHASGTDLIIIREDPSQGIVNLGTIGGADQVVFAAGHTDLVVLPRGSGLWSWQNTGGNGTLTDLSDSEFFLPSIDVAFMDGRWFYCPADGSPIFYSEVGQPGVIVGDNFFDAELLPDNNRGVINVRNTLYVLGEESIELFRSTGNVDTVVQRVDGGQIQSGYIGGRVEFDVSFAYVGRNVDGHAGIFIAGSGTSIKISNDAVDDVLLQYTEGEIAQVKSQRFTWHGVDMLMFTFLNETLAFGNGEWSFFTDDTDPVVTVPWRAAYCQYAHGRYLAGDFLDSKIGWLKDIDDDYGKGMHREIYTFVREAPGSRFTVTSAELDARMGLVPTPGLTAPTTRTEAHVASQWQIGTDSNFNGIAYDTGETLIDLTRFTMPQNLTPDSPYWWRVRHKGEVSGWSDWSAGTAFTTLASGVNQPVNITPALGATDVDPITITLVGNAFNAVGAAQTHDASRWQIATDAAFTDIVYDSGNDLVNLTAITATVNIAEGVQHYWRVQYRGTVSGYSDWSVPTSFTTAVVTVVNAPSNLLPADTEADVTLQPTLQASSFSFGGIVSQTHLQSQWQIATDITFDTIVYDSGDDPVNLETINVTAVTLGDELQYFWRVRYSGSVTGYSGWSTPTSFTTIDVVTGTPSNVTPLNFETNVPLAAVLTSSEFSSPDWEAQVHTASQWQVATDAEFTAIVFDSGTDAVNLTSITVTPDLVQNTTYYWRVRHQGDISGFSEWSTPTQFDSLLVEVVTPAILTPASGAVDQLLNLTLTGAAFASTGLEQTHTASQWQLATESTFETPVYDTGETATDLLSTDIPNGTLEQGQLYYARVRYKGSLTDWSAWSDPDHVFTTRDAQQNKVDAGNPAAWLNAFNDGPRLLQDEISFSFWFKFSNAQAQKWLIVGTDRGTLGLSISNDDSIQFTVVNDVGQLAKSLVGAFTFEEGKYYNILFSSNTLAGTTRCYVNDQPVTMNGTDTTLVWDTGLITSWGLLARQDGGASRAAQFRENADLWAEDVYIDFDIESNRRKFIAEDWTPVDLGANGELPRGTDPAIFFGSDYKAAEWNTGVNLGTNGDFDTSQVANWDSFTDA